MNGDNEEQSRNSGGEEGQSLPSPGEQVWVQCEGFRTLAYLDAKGRWKTVAKSEELKGVVKVLKR